MIALGCVRGQHTGKTFRIGDTIDVQVASVDLARRQLDLVPADREPVRSAAKARAKAPRRARKRRK